MTTPMVDPTNALLSFQKALAAGEIMPQKGQLHHDLLVLIDKPKGISRFSYALIKNRSVVALVMFALADPIKGHPCFNAGCAVDVAIRSKGYGKEVTQKAFDELIKGFKSAGVPHMYVEAIVSTENEYSNQLASKLFSPHPKECTDSVSGQPAFQYVRQLF